MSFKYDNNVFAFTGENALWETVLFIIKENIDAETAVAISHTTTGESRIHSCGRAEAIKDLYEALVAERQAALERMRPDVS